MLAGYSGPHNENVEIAKFGKGKDFLRGAAGGLRRFTEENLRPARLRQGRPYAKRHVGRRSAILWGRRDGNTWRLSRGLLRNRQEQAKRSE
jgi:hypothetical protein